LDPLAALAGLVRSALALCLTQDLLKMKPPQKKISVFISYCRESDQHLEWVTRLARFLETHRDIAVVYDGYDLRPGMSLTQFMERADSADKVLAILTPSYKRKAEERSGGVGYEAGILTSRLFSDPSDAAVIPVLRGTPRDSIPVFLRDKFYLDLQKPFDDDQEFRPVLDAIRDRPSILRPAQTRPVDAESNIGEGSRAPEWSVDFTLPEQKDGPPNRVLIVRLASTGLTAYEVFVLLQDCPITPLLHVDGHSIELTVQDFDADGRPEIAVLYHCGGHSRGLVLFRIDPAGNVSRIPGAELGSDWPLIDWHDFNGDGELEIRKRDRNWSKVPVMDYVEEVYGWKGTSLHLLSTKNVTPSEGDTKADA
jgi:TIR domain